MIILIILHPSDYFTKFALGPKLIQAFDTEFMMYKVDAARYKHGWMDG